MSTNTSVATAPTIVITGGLGNLGSKLCRHLLNKKNSQCKVILVEHPAFIDPSKPLPHDDAVVLPCDLGDPSDECEAKLREALDGADALIHFSAVNPYPNATWSESAQSMDHTFYIFQLAVICKVRRVVLATSNHVMGGYKDDPSHGPSSIRPDSDPRPGTLPLDRSRIASGGDAVAYAVAKLAGERLAMSLARLHGDVTTFVALRIGWCQPGANRPETLSAAGSPPEFLSEGAAIPEPSEDDRSDELWFKRMWLSDRDFLGYFDAAIGLDVSAAEPEQSNERGGADDEVGANGSKCRHRNVRRGFVLVNAMSKNSGAKWDLGETKRLLGVMSQDDSLA